MQMLIAQDDKIRGSWFAGKSPGPLARMEARGCKPNPVPKSRALGFRDQTAKSVLDVCDLYIR
jgi:hypothetical protein